MRLTQSPDPLGGRGNTEQERAMKIKTVRLIHAHDRDIGSKLLINGEEVARCSYDEHGSAGQDLLEQIHRKLAGLAGKPAEIDEVSDEDFEDAR
jgi:hypothetical protein